MKHSITCLSAAVYGMAFAIEAPVAGQDLGAYYSGMAFNGLVANQIAITQAGIGRNMTEAARSPSSRPDDSVTTKSKFDTRFTPSIADRRLNFARFVEKTRPVDPVGAASMEALFASTDVIGAMGAELAAYGLRVDDVADAYSVWWMNAWQAAHGSTRDLDRTTVQAVRGQAASALAASPEFRAADRRAKQELTEALLIQAAMISGSQEAYKQDVAMTAKLAAATRQGAKAMGIDLDAMTLTEKGFSPAG